MKKNRMMRLASILLVCVLLTTSVISGTFAKYTTKIDSEDSARVANWGFERSNSMDITDLFAKAYKMDDKSAFATNSVVAKEDVIAPGTCGQATFAFKYDEASGTAPEVAYTFEVSTAGSECHDDIQTNANIKWALDSQAEDKWGTWSDLMKDIEALDGNAYGTAKYLPNMLPAAFGTNDPVHTIYWKWEFSTGDDADTVDTNMGNDNALADVVIKITITATQVD